MSWIRLIYPIYLPWPVVVTFQEILTKSTLLYSFNINNMHININENKTTIAFTHSFHRNYRSKCYRNKRSKWSCHWNDRSKGNATGTISRKDGVFLMRNSIFFWNNRTHQCLSEWDSNRWILFLIPKSITTSFYSF